MLEEFSSEIDTGGGRDVTRNENGNFLEILYDSFGEARFLNNLFLSFMNLKNAVLGSDVLAREENRKLLRKGGPRREQLSTLLAVSASKSRLKIDFMQQPGSK